MTPLLFSVFVISFSLSYARKIQRNYRLFLFLSALVFILISTFRPHSGWGADTSAYVSAYNEVLSNPKLSTEVTFKLIANFVNKIGNNVTFLFFIYAFLSVLIKENTIKKNAIFPLLSWIVYLSCWFIVHDMYQIRVGASIAFFMLALPYLQEGNLTKYMLCALLATLFHTQALVLFPLFFLGHKNINGRTVLVYDFILIVSYLFYFLQIDILFLVVQLLVKIKIPRAEQLQYYYKLSQSGIVDLGKINAFSPIVLVRLFITLLLLHSYKNLNDKPLFPVLVRISMISFAVRMFFYAIPVIGMRIYEYFSVTEIFLFPMLLYVIKEKKTIHFLLFVYCIFFILLRLRTA